jgi:hypothetical protein
MVHSAEIILELSAGARIAALFRRTRTVRIPDLRRVVLKNERSGWESGERTRSMLRDRCFNR